MQRLVVGLVVVAVAALGLPFTGFAHTEFDYSLPTQDASVAEPISEITVAFTEPVTLVGNGFEVLDPQGDIVLPTPITDDDAVFRLILDQPIAGGEVGVRYEVTSLDGHVVQGGFSFVVDAPLPTTTIATTTVAPATTAPATPAPATVAPITAAPATTAVATTTTVSLSTSLATTTTVSPSTSDADDDGGSSSNAGIYIAIAAAVMVGAAVVVFVRSRNGAG